MKRFVTFVAILGLAFGAAACKEKGTMEKAGAAVDKTVEDVKDVGANAMDKASEAADEAAKKAKEATEGTH